MNDTGGIERFGAAVEAATAAPDKQDLWQELEQLADELQKPDDVAQAYRAVLDRGLTKDLAPTIAQRAVDFCQAWYIDSPEAMPELLAAIVERYPEIDWAFERLVVLLTSAGEWSKLLTLYDRALATTRDEAKRRQLLDEAARLAKDFADAPDRAAEYLQQLLVLDPTNDKVVSALERLLERGEHYADLLTLWRERLDRLPAEAARSTRARMAALCLDKLDAPDHAIVELRGLVEESPGHEEACKQLERILALDSAPLQTRRDALSLLRQSYQVIEQPESVVRVLEQALSFVTGEDATALRRECGNRLAILGRDHEALVHFGALLAQAPDDPDARRQLRRLAQRSGHQDAYVSALLQAADAATAVDQRADLWIEAAEARHRTLGDDAGAIELYRRVLEEEGGEPAQATKAARRLEELLAAAGDDAGRLPVLEQLAELEQAPSLRRQLWVDAAVLAEKLDEHQRALAHWQQALQSRPDDLDALSAVIELLEREERWEELVTALQRRAAGHRSKHAQRDDLARAADLLHRQLDQRDEATRAWLSIREQFGEDPECAAALEVLLTQAEQYEQLAELLSDSVGSSRDQAAGRLDKLAELYSQRLEQPDFALPLFEQAIELDPNDGVARDGLKRLTELPECATRAVSALARAFERTADWQGTLALLPARLSTTDEPHKRAELLRQAAVLHETEGEDTAAARACIAKAVALDPHRLDLRAELQRLAAATEGWRQAAEALHAAADAVRETSSDTAAELLRQEAAIHHGKLDDWASAFEAFQSAAELCPTDAATLVQVARSAARAGRWPAAAGATLKTTLALGRIDPELIGTLEQAAEDIDLWSDMAEALSTALGQHAAEIDADLSAKLWGHISDWYREHCDDERAATDTAQRALSAAPESVVALERLIALQRRDPGPDYAETLLLVDKLGDDRSLDALHEAAELALEGDDPQRTRQVLERLHRKATDLWLADVATTGDHSAADSSIWSLEQLAELSLGQDDADRAARLLLTGAELPVAPDKARAMSLRAAELLVQLGQGLRAIDAYRRVLAAAPQNLDAIRRLAELTEQQEQRTGSVALRQREVELTGEADQRLELRLAIAKRAAQLDALGGQVSVLKSNLAERPGHEQSLKALTTVLDERGQHGRLTDLLEEQAARLTELGESERAAGLWGHAARVVEQHLDDQARAITAHEKAVELTGAAASLDALARLHAAAGDPAAAVRWLERRLEGAGSSERVPVLLKLARTELKAGHDGAALTHLQTAFSEAPQNAELRRLLITQLRRRESWAALARTLAVAVEHAADAATVLAYAREAAEIYTSKLDAPGEACPVLRRAVALEPEDRALRAMFADSLRASGELDEAGEILQQLIVDYGRRGSKERAAAHLLLARVLHARDSYHEAVEQLEVAAKMDADNVSILATLAEMSREANDLARTERTLRTLLLTARRLQAGGGAEIGTSEVLFELSSLAAARGQQEQAEELAESAVEALAESDSHAPRLQAKLRDRGEHDLLLRLLDARLGYLDSPYRRGQVLGEKAEILAEQLDRPADALAARLQAIEADPGSPLLHHGLRELASAQGAIEQYAEKLQTLLEGARRGTDAMVRCELLLRLGELAEKEEQDFDRAAKLYADAESTGVREVDVLRARARAAGARGDEKEQMSLLGQLASLGEDQAESRADALYRMAEVQLANAESLEQGITALRKALADDPRLERAANILRRATEQHEHDDSLLDAYEQVARDSADDVVLLHYLERRAAHPDAGADQLREAVTKALALDEGERAEKLMHRAVEIGRRNEDGLYSVDWALLGLAERCRQQGNVEGAIAWIDEASTVADPDELFAISRQVAELVGERGADPKPAAKLYEGLRARDPTARGAWEPLVGIYQQLGDVEALERVVHETLDSLDEATERNILRRELAQALLTQQGREDDSVAVLREALHDDPTDEQALGLLSEHLERAGRQDDLVELLTDQLAAAHDRHDAVTVKLTSLRLGGVIAPAEAVSIYRQALEMGDDVDLLRKLLDVLGPDHEASERASLSERLLGQLDGAEAAMLASSVADLHQQLGDETAKLRVLVMGLERAPQAEPIRLALEQHYRDSADWARLADLLARSADSLDDPQSKLAMIREAAAVKRDKLGDPQAAMELLNRAGELLPDDPALRVELAHCQAAAGDRAGAVAVLSEIIDGSEPEHRVELLRARATLHHGGGALLEAMADLEQAFELAPEAVAGELQEVLDAQRLAAAEAADIDAERRATLRCAELLALSGEGQRASALLTEWTDRAGDDVEALRQLSNLDAAEQRWDNLARTAALLMALESGEPLATAASALLTACEQLGEAAAARDALEQAWAQHPDNTELRAQVRRLYELIGAHAELARLLLEEAEAIEDPEQKVGYLRWAGEALLSVGDIATAMPALTQVIEIKPDDSGARCLLADAHALMGRFDEAHMLLDEAIGGTRRGSPELCLYHQRKSYVARAQGDQAGQFEALKKAHQCGRKNGSIAAELADLAEQLEQWDVAAATLRTIATLDGDCPISPAQSLVRQGHIALRTGHRKKALLCARRAKMADSELPELQAFLQELGEG